MINLDEKISLCKNPAVQDVLREYLMGIFICRSGGSVLYSYQIDPSLNVHLISQFVAALQLFGSESVGKIKRILIEGLNVEMNIVAKHDLIVTIFFRPNMVKNYLNAEAIKGLDMFQKEFAEPLAQGKTNQRLFEAFDDGMCFLIHDYLIRVGFLNEQEVCEHRDKYFNLEDEIQIDVIDVN